MKKLILGVAIAVFSIGSAAADTTVRYAFVNPMASHFGTAANVFKAYVEDKTGGRIKIAIFPGGSLGGEREIIESLQLGTVDMAMTGTTVVGNFVPEIGVFDVPYLFRDTEHARKVFDGPIGQGILTKFKQHDLIGLGYGENGFRHLTNSKKPVETPADMVGMTIRTMESPVPIAAFKQLGARPTPIAWPDLYSALQQGVVDGEENPLSNIITAKFYQVQKYLSLTGHIFAPTVIMMSPAAWGKLSDADQKVIKEGVAKAIDAQRSEVDAIEKNGLKTLSDAGVVITKVDRVKFSEEEAPAYAEFDKTFGKATLDAIKNVK
ncbi:MAG TPA: TRAP transporter substrate-binding protein [Afipia sp.]